MQVQGSNMMDMGGNSAAAFWGATRHSSWPATTNHSAGHNGSGGSAQANPSDPKMAEKLMTELQVRFLKYFSHIKYFHRRKIISIFSTRSFVFNKTLTM